MSQGVAEGYNARNAAVALGARLRAARTRGVLSVQELAEKTHLSRSAISAIEAGTTRARMATLRVLAHALDCSPLWLMSGDGELGASKTLQGARISSDAIAEVAGVLKRRHSELHARLEAMAEHETVDAHAVLYQLARMVSEAHHD
jgi:transcriptional regulator with XRE-family HTH domain